MVGRRRYRHTLAQPRHRCGDLDQAGRTRRQGLGAARAPCGAICGFVRKDARPKTERGRRLWPCAETRAAEAADAAPSVGLCGDMRGRRPDAPLSRHHLWPCAERRAAEGRTQLEFMALCGETYRPGVAAVG